MKILNKRNLIIVGIVLVLLIALFIIFGLNNIKDYSKPITYEEINTLMNNKESFIIYYYSSSSNNKYNKETKKYLNKLKIRYYIYDDSQISKEEFKKFLTLVNMKEDTFGIPSLIYIKKGKMYGNLINIDTLEVVKQFVDNYDLYTIKY